MCSNQPCQYGFKAAMSVPPPAEDEVVLFGDGIVCKERYGSQEIKNTYLKQRDNTVKVVDDSHNYTSITGFLRAAFLPIGYPESVSDDYIQYQIWDTVQAFSGYTISTLATQAVLKGYGVGDKTATAAGATITWILKNITGYLGKIIFTWYQGTGFDSDCKRWRLVADVLNDMAILLEILAPLNKRYFTAILCGAELTRNVCGAAGCATRAAMTLHQARRNNLADVSAKDGSQETCVHLFALLFGLILIPLVAGSQTMVWTLFLLFTSLHLFANFKAVRAIMMESMNQARLHILVESFLAFDGYIMSVRDANVKEPVLWRARRKMKIILGTQFRYFLKRVEELYFYESLYKSNRYILHIDLKRYKMYIVLHKSAELLDQMKAVFQAITINFAVEVWAKKRSGMVLYQDEHLEKMIKAAGLGDTTTLLENSVFFTEKTFPKFIDSIVQEGWSTSVNLMGADEWRAVWEMKDMQSLY
ncbi:RUS family member 1-like [Lineus longissimus]|uniref:RUS family member 1-like n=1 Tax=Lineus longissimus TaxID=88925 RepID=UPI002B4EC26E